MRVELRDSLEFLFPDSKVSRRPRESMEIDVARGTTAAVHVLANGLAEGKALRMAVRAGRGRRVSAKWFRLIDVPVQINTGLRGFTEKGFGRNRFVIRRAPFRVCDAMEPARSPLPVAAATTALRLHLPIRPDERPGTRNYTIALRCGRDEVELSLTVRVHKPVVPPVGRDSWPYTNWFSLSHMAKFHKLKAGSPAHWRMIRRYAELMHHGRQNMFRIPLHEIFTRRRGRPVLDRQRLGRIVKTFTAAGMYWIEGGHFGGRTGGVWGAETFSTTLAGPLATSGEGNADVAAFASQLMAEIDRNGWRSRWIQHVADEPKRQNIPDYRIFVGMVRKYMPGIPILDAVEDTLPVGSVDIWCPKDNAYQQNRRFFDAQRAVGDRIWFYTCCFPGGPWLNRLLDMELLRPALFGWAAALFGLEGFLHWGLNMYRPGQDPFTASTAMLRSSDASPLPPGDTHVVYPGAGGPWSSLRFEAQREGIEDLELLRRLGGRDGRAASAVIRRVIRGFDDYTKDVKIFRAARKALLEKLAGV